jgi:hypothetical protein
MLRVAPEYKLEYTPLIEAVINTGITQYKHDILIEEVERNDCKQIQFRLNRKLVATWRPNNQTWAVFMFTDRLRGDLDYDEAVVEAEYFRDCVIEYMYFRMLKEREKE